MKLTIAAKLTGGSVTNIVLILLLAGTALWTIDDMRRMQDDGATSYKNAVVVTEAAALGAEMYQIIADAEINRALDVTAKDWADKKTEAEQDLATVAATADTEAEKAAMSDAKTAYGRLIEIFENEMLPKLKATPDLTPEVRDLDGKIDEQAAALATAMRKIRDFEVADADQSDVAFDARGAEGALHSMILSGIAVVLALAIAFLLARAIVRPIKAMTATMGRLARGDMSAEIPGTERKDEIGEMSQAVRVFKESMVEAERLRAEQERQKTEAAVQRKADMARLADEFEQAVGGIVKTVALGRDRAARLRPVDVPPPPRKPTSRPRPSPRPPTRPRPVSRRSPPPRRSCHPRSMRSPARSPSRTTWHRRRSARPRPPTATWPGWRTRRRRSATW